MAGDRQSTILAPVNSPVLTAASAPLQDQQKLKQEADKAHKLAADLGDELANAQERMQQMQAELKGVKDTARQQLLELEQLKTVRSPGLTAFGTGLAASTAVGVTVMPIPSCSKTSLSRRGHARGTCTRD